MNNQYIKPFNSYLEGIINDYNNSVITYDDAVSLFAKLKKSGFSGEPLSGYEAELELLHQSKEMFNTAEKLYTEQKQSEAKNCYIQVIETDANFASAQEKIAVITSYSIHYTKLYETNSTNYKNKFQRLSILEPFFM